VGGPDLTQAVRALDLHRVRIAALRVLLRPLLPAHPDLLRQFGFGVLGGLGAHVLQGSDAFRTASPRYRQVLAAPGGPYPAAPQLREPDPDQHRPAAAAIGTHSWALLGDPADRDAAVHRIRGYLDGRPETSSGEFVLPITTEVLRALRR
jgi:hypothetical protein